MNFFFGIKNNFLNCRLTIPRFQNNGKKNLDYKVFEAEPNLEKWKINTTDCNYDENFFYIENNQINNQKFFFLSNEKEIIKFINLHNDQLINLNKFTDTSPIEFRCNLSISISDKGFSSYQSEYPLSMAEKKGSVLSPISSLLDINADKNIIFFRNIYYKPIQESSNLYIVDIYDKKLLDKFKIKNNQSTEIEIDKNLIKNTTYIFTEKIIGIPLFVSIKNNHISLEHTHPPHLYILSQDRFKTVSSLKNEIRKIIDK
tara:strand:+ start:306 stop:1079 length:774 start_codon:yes stop_codon:yes gene_type:complete